MFGLVWFGGGYGEGMRTRMWMWMWTPFSQALNQFPDGWMDGRLRWGQAKAKHRQSGAVKQALKRR